MDKKPLDEKYVDFIQSLIDQVTPLLPPDVNELQKSYLCTNMKKSATMLAESMQDTEEFSALSFEQQCFYIQIMAEWSFHKEIDLFRSGISAKYWKIVMQKIWYAMWEVMYACVKNDAPDNVVLSLVERFVARTYTDAVEELKSSELINDEVEEKAKEQSNIDKMAKEIKAENEVNERIEWVKIWILRLLFGILIGYVVTWTILKFKLIGLCVIISLLVYYNLRPVKRG
ncbi:MAG: hypothetical protein NC191_00955 [Muribaculaceae bacterium]|nr:hypothetical protein [Muribaculaceae bacterium]